MGISHYGKQKTVSFACSQPGAWSQRATISPGQQSVSEANPRRPRKSQRRVLNRSHRHGHKSSLRSQPHGIDRWQYTALNTQFDSPTVGQVTATPCTSSASWANFAFEGIQSRRPKSPTSSGSLGSPRRMIAPAHSARVSSLCKYSLFVKVNRTRRLFHKLAAIGLLRKESTG
jgi:hypothetical protein